MAITSIWTGKIISSASSDPDGIPTVTGYGRPSVELQTVAITCFPRSVPAMMIADSSSRDSLLSGKRITLRDRTRGTYVLRIRSRDFPVARVRAAILACNECVDM